MCHGVCLCTFTVGAEIWLVKKQIELRKKYIDIPVTNGVGEPWYIKWYQEGLVTGGETSQEESWRRSVWK